MGGVSAAANYGVKKALSKENGLYLHPYKKCGVSCTKKQKCSEKKKK